jgi:GT2 family glycosyltransferase
MPAIVVVTYNSAEVIDDCIAACLRVPGARVIVVDNASADDTVKRLRQWPSVTLIVNAENRGFAGAVNQGTAASDEEAVLLLNPDARPVAGIPCLEQTIQLPGVGAATGRLVGSDDNEQHGFNVRALPTPATLVFEVLGLNRLWPGNPVNRSYRQRSPTVQTYVEQPAGAFLMLRRSVWVELGGFDEGFYPIWFEDVDYCKRLIENGYRVVFVPEAMARHEGGHSAGKLSWKERQLVWYGSLLRYASKHFSGASRAAVCVAVALGSIPRSVLGIRRVGIAEAMCVWYRVVCLTGQCLRRVNAGVVPRR